MVRAVVAFHAAERAFKRVCSNSISGSYRQLLPGTGLAYWRKVRPEAPRNGIAIERGASSRASSTAGAAIKRRVSLSNCLSAVIQCGGALRPGAIASTDVCRGTRRCSRNSYIKRLIDLRYCAQTLMPMGQAPVGVQNTRANCARGLRNASVHTLARHEIH